MSENVIVSAFVKIEDECDIEYRVCGAEAEVSIGGYVNDFQLVATEEGLDCLVTALSKALATIREQPIDA